MNKVFIIQKVDKGQVKYLFRVHKAVYWSEDIDQATQFKSEKDAENFLMLEVRDLKKTFYTITWYYIKNN